MKITIKELITKYPLKPAKIALSLDRSTTWLHGISHPTYKAGNQTRLENMAAVQACIRQLGQSLTTINISLNGDPGTISAKVFFKKYPFSISGVAKATGHSREWLSGIVNNRREANAATKAAQIAVVQAYIRQLGYKLKTFEIYDPSIS